MLVKRSYVRFIMSVGHLFLGNHCPLFEKKKAATRIKKFHKAGLDTFITLQFLLLEVKTQNTYHES